MKMTITYIVIAVLFLILVRYLENTSIFYPDRTLRDTPGLYGIDYEDVTIKTADHVNLHGWLIKAHSAKYTVIFFHGNAGNISGRLSKIGFFNEIGLNLLIIDYRGYGKSEGYPTELGIYQDGLAAYDYLVQRDDMRDQKIISYGASLGGVVAIDLATKRPVSYLIVDSTFSSAADMAKRIYPFMPTFLMRTKMDSIDKIQKVTVPKLFMHSLDDQVVPFSLGKKLYDAAPEPKKFIQILGTHTDGHIYDGEKIKISIMDFLKHYNFDS